MDPEASWASVNLPNSKLESLLKKRNEFWAYTSLSLNVLSLAQMVLLIQTNPKYQKKI